MKDIFWRILASVLGVLILLVLATIGLATLETINLANINTATSYLQNNGYFVYAEESGGNVTTFIELTDTPASFTGEGGKYVKVADNETELEFSTVDAGSANFSSLDDTPADLSGYAYQVPQVAANETELEFVQFTRTATYFIAASDATYQERTQADSVVSGTADDEIQAILSTVNITGGRVVLSSGTFTLADNTLTYSGDNLTFEGQGDGTVIDCSAITQYSFNILGEITSTNSTLTANAAVGQPVCNVTDGSKFAIGDWVRIRSESKFDGDASLKIGEMQKIRSVAGNVLTMEEPLLDGYLVADTATVDLLTVRENITIKNLKMVGIGSAKDQWGIYIYNAHNVRVENVTLDKFYDRSLRLHNTAQYIVTGCHIKNSNQAGLGYGIGQSNCCRDGEIIGNHFECCRHGVSHGSDGTYGVTRNIVVDGNTFIGDGVTLAGQLDTHHSASEVIFSNNIVINDRLVTIRSPFTTVIGNRCIDRGASEAIDFADPVHDVLIQGNWIQHAAEAIDMGSGSSSGVFEKIYILDNYFECIGEANRGVICRPPVTDLKISGNTFIGHNQAVYIWMINAGNELTSNIQITGNTFRELTGQGIRIISDTSDVHFVQINNNFIDGAGEADGIWADDVNGGVYALDGLQINGNMFENCVEAIDIDHYTDDVTITNNQMINCTEPYDVTLTNGHAGYAMIMGNYWKGCTSNGTEGGDSIVVRISSNVANDGTWFAGDDPG